MKKSVIMILLILFSCFFVMPLASADIEGSGGIGNGGIGGTIGSGGWVEQYGFYIAVYNSNNKQQGDTIDITAYNKDKVWEINELSGWIKKTNGNNSTWTAYPEKLYNYLDIPYGTTSGNYATLIGKLPVKLNKGDYILIEPWTKIGGAKITFRDISNNSTRTTCGDYTGPFYQCYWRPAILMAHAAKVGSNIEVGGKTYISPGTSNTCIEGTYKKGFCGYKNNKYIGYGITVVSYDQIYKQQTGKLKIQKVDNHGNFVYGAKFNIYNGKNCDNKNIKYQNRTIPGSLTLDLIQGDYSFKEVSNDSNYYKTPDTTCYNATVKAGQTTNINPIKNTLNCVGELTYIKQNYTGILKIQQLINLYKDYPSKNGLLNFDNPSCKSVTATCDATTNQQQGCLSASFTPSTISSSNVSCYTNKVEFQNNTAYCQTFLMVNSQVGKGPFNSKSGQMYIMSKNGEAVTSTLKMNCYLYGSNLPGSFSAGNYSNYLSDFIFGETLNKKDNPEITLIRQGNSNLYTTTIDVKYYFNSVYVNNGDGKFTTTNCPNCKFLGYGKISKFTDNFIDKKLNFEFSLTLNKKYDFDGECKYSVTPEIITPPPPNGPPTKYKMNLEFRTVDTDNPFLKKSGSGTRNTKTNWCTGDDCTATNCIVENVMNNRNDSGLRKGTTPLYKITLTPSDIKAIRAYNKKTSYDDYTLECDNDGNNCKSRFLNSLKNGVLKFYNINTKEFETIGNISKLIVGSPTWLSVYDETKCK